MRRPSKRLKISVVVAVTVLFLAVATIRELVSERSLNAISISFRDCSFSRYDDGAGSLALGAWIDITNSSPRMIWYVGFRGSPAVEVQQFIDDKWTVQRSWTSRSPDGFADQWTAVRGLESISVLAGGISEDATRIRVGIPFASGRFSRKVQWIFSPAVEIQRRDEYYFPNHPVATRHHTTASTI